MSPPTPRYNLALLALVWLAGLALWAWLDEETPRAAIAADKLRVDDGAVRSCQACHQFEVPQHLVGPHLVDVLGRRAGSATGFDYSDAMGRAGFVWTPDRLRDFLMDPQRVVPGTTMPVSPLDRDAAEAVARYLEERD